jgi:hypothetical protein
MLLFNNCSHYKAGLLQKGCISSHFQMKTKSLKLDAVIKNTVLGKLFSVLNR